jgi:hypothetical protein
MYKVPWTPSRPGPPLAFGMETQRLFEMLLNDDGVAKAGAAL